MNAGALYQLPELRADRFAEFRHNRQSLQAAYGRRVTAGMRTGIFTRTMSARLATELVFALAESVISIRSTRGDEAPDVAPVIASACLRVLSCDDDALAEAAAGAASLLTGAG